MTATAEAVIRRGRVVCSRCGAEMKPEAGVSFKELRPRLWWRCATGHLTQAVPLPGEVNVVPTPEEFTQVFDMSNLNLRLEQLEEARPDVP